MTGVWTRDGTHTGDGRNVSIKSERQTPSIFVSYRIADTLPIADRLAAELQRTFGAGSVFFDRRTIEPGDTWDSDIETAVKGAAVVLVLIGRKWLTEQNEYGRRRLDVSGDWVRRE
ncbi:MAG: TIR domain-containing protein, partial [Gammaproteobacteria bacterium]|nr:TIR domain-containing protein [Gammaproteobacteria bacterium]